VIAIRVQELYGLAQHPALAGGRAPLTLHLLSPAHRPIQITKDLPGFWRGSWAAVKAEAFAEAVRALVPEVKMVLWDERLTTVAAQRALHEAGRNTKQSRAVIDQVAAQLILQGWLDSQAFLAQ
jgi:hypothetical protein